MMNSHDANYIISTVSALSSVSYSIKLNKSALGSPNIWSPLSASEYYSALIDPSLIPLHIDQVSSLYNSTYSRNSTDIFFEVWNHENIAEESWKYCNEWTRMQNNVYQTANVIMFAAFLIPATFKQSVLLVRALLTISYILLSCYSSTTDLCAADMLIWNILLCAINLFYTCSLIWRFSPPTFSLELTELYTKMFQPLRVSKKHFKELVREAEMVTLNKSDIYAVEGASPADERLSILISGKLRVTCDDTHLHFINVHQFIDSPEWEANHEQSDDLFQVTITVEEDAVYLCWSRMRLERILRHRPLLKIVLDCIIGKDITQKLYSLNDHFCGLDIERAKIKQAEIQEIWIKATRSMSMDAVYTGPTGKVRSVALKTASAQKNIIPNISALHSQFDNLHQQCWIPIVANHFPVEFPFAGLQAYNAQVASHNTTLAHTITEINQAQSTSSPILSHTDIPEKTIKRTFSSIRRPQREVKFEDAPMI